MEKSGTKMINLRVPVELLGRVDEAAGAGNRTQWLVEAAEARLSPVALPPRDKVVEDLRGEVARLRKALELAEQSGGSSPESVTPLEVEDKPRFRQDHSRIKAFSYPRFDSPEAIYRKLQGGKGMDRGGS